MDSVEVAEEDSEAAVVVVDTNLVVVTNMEVAEAEVAINNSSSMEDQWVVAEAVVVAEVATNRTTRVVVEIHNIKQRCVKLFRMILHAVTVTNANLHIPRKNSTTFLSSSSNTEEEEPISSYYYDS